MPIDHPYLGFSNQIVFDLKTQTNINDTCSFVLK